MRVHRKFAVEEGDHLTMLNVYEAFIKVSTVATPKAPSMLRSIGGHLLLLFSHSAMSSFLRPRGLQHARLPCPSLSPAAQFTQIHVH